MFSGKPIIGIVGGIGSGKSFVARIFGEMGCLVINSDEQVAQLYRDEQVKQVLASWWGLEILDGAGNVDRRAVARRVFADPEQRRRLEGLLHPRVAALRDEAMRAAANDPAIQAYVWDTPLLVEVGLAGQCDALVFVDAPLEARQRRVAETRGWRPDELTRREKLQIALDKKRRIANYIVRNTAGADQVRDQVREVISRILAAMKEGMTTDFPGQSRRAQ